MESHRSFIQHWRKFRGMTQREVVDKLAAIKAREATRENFPATEASLSRVEKGEQNFNMALLRALAEIFDADEPGHLLTINPFAGTLSVIHALEKLNPIQQEAAMKIIEAMRTPLPDPDK